MVSLSQPIRLALVTAVECGAHTNGGRRIQGLELATAPHPWIGNINLHSAEHSTQSPSIGHLGKLQIISESQKDCKVVPSFALPPINASHLQVQRAMALGATEERGTPLHVLPPLNA